MRMYAKENTAREERNCFFHTTVDFSFADAFDPMRGTGHCNDRQSGSYEIRSD